ncbi:MAG: GNAT family N-acetyltransferase [Alphaproteobacteria bacterium]|nr:GNAT family N-acetyltransferase [Alphaproteobacteria bacterium]
MASSNVDTIKQEDLEKISVRIARTKEEVLEAQRLRYAVFYEENGAIPDDNMRAEKRDFDDFDDIADHLIVIHKQDNGQERIVGTYRLLRQAEAEKFGRFYSADEYDLKALIDSNESLLELGRSCVLAEYRTQPVLNMLWHGIADYITDHDIDILFGCASFSGTDVDSLKEQLSYLYHFHSAPENISPVATRERYINMNIVPKENIDEKKAFSSLPPLIKGYLRLGATIGNGAVIDKQFNTVDVCIVVQTKLMTQRYRKYYERRIRKTMPGQRAIIEG